MVCPPVVRGTARESPFIHERLIEEEQAMPEQIVQTEHTEHTEPVYESPAYPAPVYQAPVHSAVYPSNTVVSTTSSRFSLAQFVHGLCGFGLVLFGAVAVARGGFDGSASDQTAQVAGIDMTTVLGLVTVGFGLLLIVAALTPGGRVFGGFIGGVLVVAGVMLVAGSDQFLKDLRTESSLGWLAIAVGTACLLVAFVPEYLRTSRRRVVEVR
jgi:hypothetical protein